MGSVNSFTMDVGLPASEQAERTILGAILLEPGCLDAVMVGLRPIDFSLHTHQTIAAAMGRLAKGNHAIDLVTLSHELARSKDIHAVGGVAYLASLTEGLPRRPIIDEYIRIVKDKAILRQVMLIGSAAISRAAEQVEPALEIAATVQKQLEVLAKRNTPKPRTLGDQVMATMDKFHRERKGEVKTFVPAGFELIDESAGGYALGELTVIAARPKVGKSVLLRQGIYENCNRYGNHCHLISPEMDEDKVLRLLAARKANLPWKTVRHPMTMNPMQVDYLTGAMSDIADWPLTLDCTYPISATEAISRAVRVKEEHNTQLLGIDYLQKLDWGTKYEHRFAMIGDAWVGLANLAKTGSQMAVVAISSLTIPNGKNINDPPTADEMRGSGEGKYELSTLYLVHRKTDPETNKMAHDGRLIAGLTRLDEDGAKSFVFNPDMLTLEAMR